MMCNRKVFELNFKL